MGILPERLTTNNYKININAYSDNKNQGLKTYIIDFKNKKVRYFNNKMVVDDYELATKMYIQKLILTEQHKYFIYKKYGTNYIEKTLGKKYHPTLHRVAIEDNLREQLLKYYNIVNVSNIKIVSKLKTLYISFYVTLKKGKILEWEEEIAI